MEDEIVLDETMEEGIDDNERMSSVNPYMPYNTQCLVSEMKKGAAKKKGRGFDSSEAQKQHVKGYESLGSEGGSGPQRSVEVE
jgi:hypothetical protein